MKIKITNVLKATFVLSLLLINLEAYAQSEENEEQKVVIVEKIVDENGNETVKEKVLTGEEAAAYLESKEMETILEKEIDIEKLKMELEEQELQVIEIERKILEDIESQMNVEVEEENGEYTIRINRDGQEMEWHGEGALSEDVLKELESMEIEIPEMPHFDHESIILIQEEVEDRPVMGVMIENAGGNGAMVTEVFDGSGAAAAGLSKGDIIFKVDGEKVTSVESLVDALSEKSVGDKVKVKFLREGKKRSEKVELGAMEKKFGMHPMKNCEVRVKKECHPDMSFHKKHSGKKNVKKIVVMKKDGDVIAEDIIVERATVPTPEIDLYELSIYPNPGDGAVNIEFRAAAVPTTVKVLGMDGRELYSRDLPEFNGHFNEVLDIERQDGGVILQIQQNGQVYTETILK